ncbi:hypothetical protein [Streptomyces solicathayae]|uniref:Uncharacterized protein n=1 Tax=Streptomyces solicathayae TaxID=3081768 RepID=A0ABZ0LM70_9ACTN|nr:hypothetical protein [Streptomyces sp. HUAS YS2]WOX19904.1 hypothetical protein R2D22_00150 [Streptomyces sp. HUAS YS2]
MRTASPEVNHCTPHAPQDPAGLMVGDAAVKLRGWLSSVLNGTTKHSVHTSKIRCACPAFAYTAYRDRLVSPCRLARWPF